jgi:hypothetical protein
MLPRVRAFAVGGENAERALGQHVALGQHLAHDDRPERRLGGGLHHERTAHRVGRRDLVRGEVQGEVVRADEAAPADGNALPHPLIALGARVRALSDHSDPP